MRWSCWTWLCVSTSLILLCSHIVSGTVLTATMLTSFMGGFLMGKMTLGGLLMIMQGLNNGGQGNNPSKTRDNSPADTLTTKQSEFQLQMENDIRDKFLRQLGEMDPLNCLPKVFCELSAQTVVVTKEEEPADEEKEKSSEEDEEASESRSDENVEDYHLQDRRKKQKLKIEDEALEKLMEETNEPTDYYFILKDRSKLQPKWNHQHKESASPPFWPPSYTMDKKRGRPDASEYKSKSGYVQNEKSDKTIDDLFADDPFFDEFSRSMKMFPETVDYSRVGRQLRRIDKESLDFRRKFRVAAKVGEQSTKSCQHVFNTCPFEANQIMAMVNTLKMKNAAELYAQSNPTKTPPKSLNEKLKLVLEESMNDRNANLQSLKNTLLAIESINNATLLAQTKGVPVSYKEVLADVIENDESDAPAVSTKILADFDKEIDLLTKKMVEDDKISTTQTPITTTTTTTETVEISTIPEMPKSVEKRERAANKIKKRKNTNSNKYRILRNKAGQSEIPNRRHERSVQPDHSSSSEESTESPKIAATAGNLKVEHLVAGENISNGSVFLGRINLNKHHFEDDEQNASEEENIFIPEFSNFNSNYKKRPRPSANKFADANRPSTPKPAIVSPLNNFNNEQFINNSPNKIYNLDQGNPDPHNPLEPYINPPNPNYNTPSQSYNHYPNLNYNPIDSFYNNPNGNNNYNPNPNFNPNQYINNPSQSYHGESLIFNTPSKLSSVPPKPPRKRFPMSPIEDDEADAHESDRAVEKIIATRHQIKSGNKTFRTGINGTTEGTTSVISRFNYH